MWRSWAVIEKAIVGGDQQKTLQKTSFFFFFFNSVSPLSFPHVPTFPPFSFSGKAKVQIKVAHFHLKFLELKVEMFPPQLSTARTEGRVHKCSSMLKSKNNINPSDYVTGTIQGSTEVNDLESNNLSFAAGAYVGCWDVWCTRFYTL